MQLSKFELFIFDWDGTLMNTTQTIVDATHHACNELGLKKISDEAAKSIIGCSFVEVISQIVPELNANPALFQKFVATYEAYLNAHLLNNPLFADVVESLAKLNAAGKLLAIATGRDRQLLDDTLVATGLAHYFVITKTASDCFSKPHPQMIEEILEFTGVKAEHALMIGDTTHDVQMAHNAGVTAIAVSHGAQDAESLAKYKPQLLLKNISEFYQLLDHG